MSLAGLFNTPRTNAELAQWAFFHMAHHRDLNTQVFKLHNIVLPEYVLDPIIPGRTRDFLNLHQVMHNDLDFILGIASNDLTDVDWEDEAARDGWIFLNATLHVSEAQAAGL